MDTPFPHHDPNHLPQTISANPYRMYGSHHPQSIIGFFGGWGSSTSFPAEFYQLLNLPQQDPNFCSLLFGNHDLHQQAIGRLKLQMNASDRMKKTRDGRNNKKHMLCSWRLLHPNWLKSTEFMSQNCRICHLYCLVGVAELFDESGYFSTRTKIRCSCNFLLDDFFPVFDEEDAAYEEQTQNAEPVPKLFLQ